MNNVIKFPVQKMEPDPPYTTSKWRMLVLMLIGAVAGHLIYRVLVT